jgi:hypothetical protein
MPTKTSYSSPLTYGTTLGSPEELENILNQSAGGISTEDVSGGKTPNYDASKMQAAGQMVGLAGQMGSSLINADNTDPLSDDYKKKATTSGAISGAASGASAGSILGPWGMLAGAAIGGIYGGITSSKQAEKAKFEAIRDKELETRKSNLTMTGKQKPIKALTQMQGTTAHNMSAKQYNKALQMKEISGANTLPSSLTMIENPSPKQEAAFDHNNDGKVSTKELKTTFNS